MAFLGLSAPKSELDYEQSCCLVSSALYIRKWLVIFAFLSRRLEPVLPTWFSYSLSMLLFNSWCFEIHCLSNSASSWLRTVGCPSLTASCSAQRTFSSRWDSTCRCPFLKYSCSCLVAPSAPCSLCFPWDATCSRVGQPLASWKSHWGRES